MTADHAYWLIIILALGILLAGVMGLAWACHQDDECHEDD